MHNHSSLISFDKVYYVKNNKSILENISFNLNKQEMISLIGPNGAGKTTLCKILLGIIKPTSGKIIKSPKVKISYIPQINHHNIFVPIKAKDFILLNNKTVLEDEDYEIIKTLKLENHMNKFLKDLSGGEKQKLMLLRSIIAKPDVVLLDEPDSFVDFSAREEIYSLINNYKVKEKFSVIIISHDLNMVLRNTDIVICLQNGKIGCSGIPEEIKSNDIFKKLFSNYKYYQHKDK